MKPPETHIKLSKLMKSRWGTPAKIIKYSDEYNIRSITVGIFGSGDSTIWCTIGNFELPLGCELALVGQSEKTGNYLSSAAFILWNKEYSNLITAEDAGLLNNNKSTRHAFFSQGIIKDMAIETTTVKIAAGIMDGDSISDEVVIAKIAEKWANQSLHQSP